jgi:hypothetical protein
MSLDPRLANIAIPGGIQNGEAMKLQEEDQCNLVAQSLATMNPITQWEDWFKVSDAVNFLNTKKCFNIDGSGSYPPMTYGRLMEIIEKCPAGTFEMRCSPRIQQISIRVIDKGNVPFPDIQVNPDGSVTRTGDQPSIAIEDRISQPRGSEGTPANSPRGSEGNPVISPQEPEGTLANSPTQDDKSIM